MAEFTKITAEDLADKGVIGLPDTPNLSTQAMQEKFDEIALDVIVPKFNNLIDELDDSDIDGKVSSSDMTNIRLNADKAIEYSDDGGTTWGQTASSGHRIMDYSGGIMAQESRMQFVGNVTVTDDAPNGKTVINVTGQKGDKGDTPNIYVGNVTSGNTVSVTKREVGEEGQKDAIFDFVLEKGDAGVTPNFAIGSVSSGQSAAVTISYDSYPDEPRFNFTLPKGDKGDTGQGINIRGEYDTLADLETAHPTGQAGWAYMVGTTNPKDLYVWDVDNEEWVNEGELQGAKGDTGATPSFSIGTVTSGSTASVTIGGTTDYPTLSFVLPKGDTGSQGSSGTVIVGNVYASENANVINTSGDASNAVLDFYLPKGDKGDRGAPTTVNGQSGDAITLYGTSIFTDSTLAAVPITTAMGTLSSLTTTAQTSLVAAINEVDADIDNKHKVTSLTVSTSNWSTDTTSQSGSTLYKKQISLNHVYANPIVDIGCASGSVLPTTAEQEAYDLLEYVTADDTVPCLYLYASDIPTDTFYINAEGCD